MRTGKPNEPLNKAKLRREAFQAARGILFEKNVPSPNIVKPKEEDLQKIKTALPKKKKLSTSKQATPKKRILSKSKSTTKKNTVRPKKIK